MPVRLLMVSALLFAIAIAVAVIAITLGEYPLTVGDVFAAISGSGKKFHRIIVMDWRLPVTIAAVLFGALLGIGGAIFQSLTRNPLGSPDVIGFDAGSYTAVVLTILVLGSRNYWSIAAAAIIGGLATAFITYLLAYRRGIQGFRLIIVGIGISAMLGSINAYLITRADIDDAMTVGFWGAGSITRVSWSSMTPSLPIAAVIVLSAALLAPALRKLELGDDAAITQGAWPGATRLALMITGVATVALVTAAAGPIGFIALVAPQLARRLTRSPGVSLLGAAAVGAALLGLAHLLALVIGQYYRAIPVGLITVCLGGIYLIWLLIRETERNSTVATSTSRTPALSNRGRLSQTIPTPNARVVVDEATIGYDKRIISERLSVDIPDGSFTAIIGPNGCGKSTLLRAIARVLTPTKGQVLLDGKAITSYRSKEVARRLGLLPQTSLSPDGIRVADLVARGRAPYQNLFQQWRTSDEDAVEAALTATKLTDLSGRLVDELSGGQRQRVWVAMLLAQDTPIMLLDEPTTFLDITHQYELMELFRSFHDNGKTLVSVLHDLNQAARYADHLIVMRDGNIITTGRPADVITAELIGDVFGLRALVVPDPVTGTPNVVPLDPRTVAADTIRS